MFWRKDSVRRHRDLGVTEHAGKSMGFYIFLTGPAGCMEEETGDKENLPCLQGLRRLAVQKYSRFL